MECTAEQGYLLTIIVPLYNEEGNLLRVATELSNYLFQTPYKAKILFVNDGSTDKSASIIEKLCAENPLFSFIQLKKNGGLSVALKAGIDQVETKLTGYMDADLQTTPFDFDQLMEYAESYELVTGIRLHRKDGIIKRITSTIANAVRNLVTHDRVSDTGCPLKIMHTSTARRIPLFNGMHRFLPALVQLDGGNVKEIPVRHFQRVAGKSNYQLHNRLIGPFADLIAFIWIRKRYIRYEISAKG
jgi:glycosyltransferase involved in cell wall biosynthesis